MKNSTINTVLLAILVTLLFQGCSNNDNSTTESILTDTLNVTKSKDEGIMRIKAFNDVNSLTTTLSQNGIGNLKQWQNPMDMGYGSLTDYFPIGNPAVEFGLANNLAYYLEGTENAAKTLLINLNINNPAEKKQALKHLSDITQKTFESLSLSEPAGLIEAIKSAKEFKAGDANFTASFSLDKSKIETWKMLIASK